MESPVRIKSGFAVFITICLLIGATDSYPNKNINTTINQNVTQNSQEPSTTIDKPQIKDNNVFRFMPKNITGRYQTVNVTSTPKPTANNLNNTQSTETTPSISNKIHGRGTVKYFSTRPPFKPKIPMRRNITLLRTQASERSSVTVPLSKEIVNETTTLKDGIKSFTPKPVKDILNSKRNINNVTPKSERETVTYKLSKEIITPKPVKEILSKNKDTEAKSSKETVNMKINRGNFTSKIIKNLLAPKVNEKIIENTSAEDEDNSDVTEKTSKKPRDRSEDSKSLNADFNIDKYTSPEFHDINNVYSQAVSPDVEHYIVPENAANYYVTVDTGSYMDVQRRFFAATNVLTTPQTVRFDKRYKEVSDGIRQNLADAEYFAEEATTEPADASKEVDFQELLSRSPNNNSQVMYKNTKELILSDSQNALTNRRDYMDSNGTKIFYEMSMVSTENYEQKSSTIRSTLLPNSNDNSDQNEITTQATVSSNKIAKFSLLDDKPTKIEPSVENRRVDHLKSNETRKAFLTTTRMRAHTTPKPRIRISLKNNRIEQNTSSPISTTTESSSKSPDMVKLFPFRRRTTLTTASSKIDPVLQDTSPFKLVGHTKSDSENSIPTLRKRGSVKYYESPDNLTSKTDDLSSELTIPPTATAWALITLKDTPVVKKQNATLSGSSLPLQIETSIKAEDDLQKLDKSTEANIPMSDSPSAGENLSTVTLTRILSALNNNSTTETVEKKASFNQVTSPSNNNYVTALLDSSNDNINKTNGIIKEATVDDFLDSSLFESITKFPSTVTTPVYERDTSAPPDFISEDDYYGTTGDDIGDFSTFSSKDAFSNGPHSRYTTTREDVTSRSSTDDDDFFSNMDLTTYMSKPYAQKTTITTGDNLKESTTLQDITTTDIITTADTPTHTSYKFKKITSNYSVRFDTTDGDNDDDEFLGISTTDIPTTTQEATTTIPYSFSLTTTNVYTTDKSTDDATTKSITNRITTTIINDDVTSTMVPDTTTLEIITENNLQSNVPTTTVVDDITDFTFSSSYTTEKDGTTTLMSKSNSPDISNSVDITTMAIKTSTQDMDAASTHYYGTTNSNTDYITSPSTTVTQTSPLEDVTLKPTTHNSIVTETNNHSLMTSEEILDSRETTTTDEDDTNSPTDTEDNNEDPDAKNIDSNEVTKTIILDNEKSESDITKSLSSDTTNNELPSTNFKPKEHDLTTASASSPGQNIEVINPESVPNSVESLPRQTTVSYTDDLGGQEGAEDSSGAIAAIAISVIGVIALILLVGILVMARGRRRGGGYGQRCTPVSLDSYSLDNVSGGGSARRKARRPSKRSYGNPAYDESGATSHPMQFAALANFALDQDSIVNEFNEIPTITTRADEVPPGCESKNRYSNVIPLPETRVSLKPVPGDETSEYINANYVRGPKSMKNYYIACQAPLSSTVNDFWRMIWEQNSRVVLMLTEYMENGAEKCYEYLPPSEVSDNKRSFGDYQVIVKKREVRDKYVISSIQLRFLPARVWREITHIWYFWPARGVPEECHSIIAFLIEARSYLKASQTAKDHEDDGQDSMVTQNGSVVTHQTHISMEEEDSNEDNDVNIYNLKRAEEKLKNGGAKNGNNENGDSRNRGGPLVVHCSPGTGRTGALIACDIGIRDFEMSRTVDIPKTVYRIRRDRANAVQTKDQYIFIYKVLSEYATKLTGGVLDSI